MKKYLLWHEGALGDLLLTRLAVAALKIGLCGELFLCARNEARFLFKEAGLVQYVASTERGPCFWLDYLRPEAVFVFGGPRLLALFKGQTPVYGIETRPRGETHLALQMLAQVQDLLGLKGVAEKAVAQGLCLGKGAQPSGPLWIHPGSGGRFKCAPPAWTKALATHLEAQGLSLEVILGPAEKDLRDLFSGPKQGTFLPRDLAEAQRRLSKGRGFVGFDSGLSHLAASLGLPTVAIFGPTPWRYWAPFGPQVLVLVQRCSCLLQGKDPRACEDPCLGHLPPDQVAQWVSEFINTTAKNPGMAPGPEGLEKSFSVVQWSVGPAPSAKFVPLCLRPAEAGEEG